MAQNKKDMARFDARISKEQKELFEEAANYGGYRTLTDFVISVVQEQAVQILKRRDQIIASENDAEVFFNAITKPRKPNAKLRKGMQEYMTKYSKRPL